MITTATIIALGTVYTQFLEWVLHKYVLHGHTLGKKPHSPFSFHWKSHHRKARITKFYDKDYEGLPRWDASGKEVLALSSLAVLHAPLYWISPILLSTLVGGAIGYYFIHRHSHLHPEWAMKWLPWHYDHHMGKDQDKNWGVTTPLFDYIFSTREGGQAIKDMRKGSD